MLWLAGLMGMMVLGSVAVVSTPDLMARDAEDDEQADAAPLLDTDEAASQKAMNRVAPAEGSISSTCGSSRRVSLSPTVAACASASSRIVRAVRAHRRLLVAPRDAEARLLL